jgi:hypothetical protein
VPMKGALTRVYSLDQLLRHRVGGVFHLAGSKATPEERDRRFARHDKWTRWDPPALTGPGLPIRELILIGRVRCALSRLCRDCTRRRFHTS